MELFENPAELRHAIHGGRDDSARVAFVPTMGYLHEGHVALIRHAAQLAPRVVVSIFVNPLQFGPNEDLERYPRDLERDKRLAAQAGATHLFFPSADLLTPPGLQVKVDPGPLAEVMCGRSRPGHFAGVATIVAKLFNIVRPDVAVFGWKDAQQLIIMRKMVEDLDFPVRVEGVETIREPDGLAMSSRNVYLTPDQRREAPEIYRALQRAAEQAHAGEILAERLRKIVVDAIQSRTSGQVDYVEVVRLSDLKPLAEVESGNTLLTAAVFLGQTRLIDNIRIETDNERL